MCPARGDRSGTVSAADRAGRGRVGAVCGRYAASSRPEDLVEEFEIEETDGPGPGGGPGRRRARLQRRSDQAGARRPRAPAASGRGRLGRGRGRAGGVDRRGRRRHRGRRRRAGRGRAVRRRGRRGRRAGALAAAAHLGARPVLGQGPLRRQPDDQRARRDDPRQARLQAGRTHPALPRAGRRLVRVAEEPDGDRRQGQAAQAAVLRPPRRAGADRVRRALRVLARPGVHPDDPAAWLTSFTVVTTAAEPGLDVIHDRMPLVLPRDRWDAWLDPGLTDADDVRALVEPPVAGRFLATAVSTRVNAVGNNGPELLEAVPVADLRGVVDPATGELIGGGSAPLF